MAKKPKKLNAMRLLEKHGIAYEVVAFSPELHSALDVADATGIPTEKVFKTLVVQRARGKPLLVMIPAPASLNLKALARAVGEKKLSMASHAEAEKLTGLQVGGIGALALTAQKWDAVIDESALSYDAILVSAGQRGINLKVSPNALLDVLKAKTAPVARPSE